MADIGETVAPEDLIEEAGEIPAEDLAVAPADPQVPIFPPAAILTKAKRTSTDNFDFKSSNDNIQAILII